MPASTTKFSGEVHDLVTIRRIEVLGLKSTMTTKIANGKKVTLFEWRDEEGKLYFYTVRNVEEKEC